MNDSVVGKFGQITKCVNLYLSSKVILRSTFHFPLYKCGNIEKMPLPKTPDVHSATDDLLTNNLFGSRENLSKYSMTPDAIMEKVTEFASAGLRTLVMGARYCPPEQWIKLKSDLDSARSKLDGREAAISQAYKAIESDLVLVGCTGIEDKLQDGVPETLIALRNAGIQVRIVTTT